MSQGCVCFGVSMHLFYDRVTLRLLMSRASYPHISGMMQLPSTSETVGWLHMLLRHNRTISIPHRERMRNVTIKEFNHWFEVIAKLELGKWFISSSLIVPRKLECSKC